MVKAGAQALKQEGVHHKEGGWLRCMMGLGIQTLDRYSGATESWGKLWKGLGKGQGGPAGAIMVQNGGIGGLGQARRGLGRAERLRKASRRRGRPREASGGKVRLVEATEGLRKLSCA